MDFHTGKRYGFGFLKQDRPINEEDLREFKISKTSSCGEGVPFHRSNAQQMLSFSSQPPLTLPHYHYTSTPFDRNAGISMQGMRGPFTPSQWMELEHQALIYKYITSNVPIPSCLLNPIRKAFDSAGFSLLTSNALGWGGFRLGMSNSDPEPGRCRRTDGKKWRCSRDAVVDQKYCDRHMNRGRHRSRKPVEPQSNSTPITRAVVEQHSTVSKATPTAHQHLPHKHQNAFQEFGLVCSDSLLNPLNRSSSLVGCKRYNNDENDTKSQLRQFMDEWPNADTHLSISIPRELEMGLGVGTLSDDRKTPISWESSSIGGPLGEALHTKQLNLIDGWGSASSPTGVLQRGPFASLSNSSAASSPRSSYCNGIINPSLPAL